MPYLKSSQVTGLSPKPIDVTGFTQSASEDLEGTYSQHEVLLADAFNVTDNVTISDNLILAKLSDDGEAITLTGNATTTRTIAGSGSLEGSTFAQTPNASLTGMTGVVGSAVTGRGITSGTITGGTITGGVTFPVGHIVQMKFVHPESADSSTANGTGSSSSASDELGWLEFDSNLRITLTPLSASNNIILWCNVFFGGNNTGLLFHMRFAKGITEGTGLGGTMVNKGATQDLRTSAHCSIRQNNYDVNDGHNYSFMAQETAGGGARTYYIQSGNEGNNTHTRYFHGPSATSHQLGYVKPMFIAYEVQT